MSLNAVNIGFSLDAFGSVKLWTRRSVQSVTLVLETRGAYCEIGLEQAHLEALREQLPDALAGLDRWAVEEQGCVKAADAEERAIGAAARAVNLAVEAEQAGARDTAASLREAAAEATARAEAANAAVRAFEDAAVEADYAAERLNYVSSEAEAALRGLRDDDRPAEHAATDVLVGGAH